MDITELKRAQEELQRQLAELEQANAELERFNRAAVDRELRMIELKKEVNALCERAGLPRRYPLEFENGEERRGEPTEDRGPETRKS